MLSMGGIWPQNQKVQKIHPPPMKKSDNDSQTIQYDQPPHGTKLPLLDVGDRPAVTEVNNKGRIGHQRSWRGKQLRINNARNFMPGRP